MESDQVEIARLICRNDPIIAGSECPTMAIAGRHGRIPLFFVKSVEMAELLLTMDPDSAAMTDEFDYTPFHFLLRNKSVSLAVLTLVFQAYPRAVILVNDIYMSPLATAEAPDLGISKEITDQVKRWTDEVMTSIPQD